MKKAGKGCLIIIAVLFVLGLIGAAGSKKGGSTTSTTPAATGTTANSQPSAAPTAMTYEKVTAKTMTDDFDKNKLSADDKYKNKNVEFSAKVKNISEDIMGSPFLSLEPPTADQYYFGTTLKCTFQDKEVLKTLENGKTYTVRGTVNGMSVGIIDVKDCSIVQ